MGTAIGALCGSETTGSDASEWGCRGGTLKAKVGAVNKAGVKLDELAVLGTIEE